MKLAGAVVIVTGASSGIGAATARVASRAGAHVVLAARREDRLRELERELGDALAVRCDVTDSAQLANVVARTTERFGRIDVLVNNAGQGLHVPLAEVRPQDFRAILELDLVAPLVAMQAVIPAMRRQHAGAIVNVSSGTTLSVLPGTGPYATAKAGLNLLSAIARAELAPDGIAVSTVYPYVTATEFHARLLAGTMRHRPAGQAPVADPPERVADAILELIRTGAERIDLASQHFEH